MISKTFSPIQQENMIPGVVIILGSPNNELGELSEIGIGRLELGHKLFKELRSSGWKIILAGGFGEHFNTTDTPNAEYAKRFLLNQGVAPENILDVALSCDTVDDALKSRLIVDKYNISSLLVISSDFHLPRVEFIFRRVFPDKELSFAGAGYLQMRDVCERERLIAHETRELESLRERGESIVVGCP